MDALPGRYTQTWFQADKPGRYEIFCTEYCGLGHSAMLGELVVMPAAEFDAWIAQQRSGARRGADGRAHRASPSGRPRTSSEEGRRVAAEQGCLACHSVDGTRHIGPTWADLYLREQKLANGKTVVADEGYLTKSMMDPAAEVVAGYQNVMPTYQGKLTPPEVAAIVEYIKSLRTAAVRTGPSTEGPAYESIPAASDAGYNPRNYLNAPATGLRSWLNTRDHKRIGVMFLIATTIAFALGGSSRSSSGSSCSRPARRSWTR